MTCPSADRKETIENIARNRKRERTTGNGYAVTHYSQEDLDRICDLAGISEEKSRTFLSIKVNQAATWLLTDLRSADRPVPSEAEKHFGKIENALDRTLRALGLTAADDPEDGMPLGPIRDHFEYLLSGQGHKGEQELRRLVSSVGFLRNLAEKARSAAADDKGIGKYRGDEAINALIGRLLEAYRRAGGNPRLSRNSVTEEPGGPTLRFVGACLDLIRNNYPEIEYLIPDQTKEALASRIGRIRRSAKSHT